MEGNNHNVIEGIRKVKFWTVRGSKCNHCDTEFWNAFNFTWAEIILRDSTTGFFRAEVCTNAPVGIMELAKSEMRAKVQLQIQKGKGSQKGLRKKSKASS